MWGSVGVCVGGGIRETVPALAEKALGRNCFRAVREGWV